MKKLLCVLLVILVLFGLCACGGAAAPEKAESKSSESGPAGSVSAESDSGKQGSTDFSYDLAIPVTIPAAFTLYLDENMNIVCVDDCDEVAQNLFAQLDVANMPYEEGIALILETACTQEILQDGSEVVFDLNPDIADSSLIASLCVPCVQFSTEQKIELSVIPNFNVELMSDRHTDGQKLQKSLIFAEKQDENGDWVPAGSTTLFSTKNVTIVGMLGDDPAKYVVKDYMSGDNGDIFVNYYEDGIQYRSYSKYADGQYSYYEYEKGAVTGMCHSDLDGSYYFKSCKNGVITSEFGKYTDGAISTTTYDSNGVMVSNNYQSPDGSVSVTTYDPDGNMTGSYTQSPDGTISSSTYGVNGSILSSHYESPDGNISDSEYDSNGMIISTYNQSPDGSISRTTYYASGYPNVSEAWSNGEHMVWTYAEDGTLLETIQESWDGTIPDNE
ncbi:MAG: hypothetical protein IKT52_07040 [Oscillospiraceae bacterium]|nr:hypothetical protein [Oscillospiraceae bacterium]